jgi:hypothetical protein
MRKVICLAVVALMIACMGCAAKRMPITQNDLKNVKGTWEGTISYGLYDVQQGPMTLEILNDTVPIKGKVTLDVPQIVASQYATQSGKQSKENPDGKLTPQGTILWTGGGAANHSMEFFLTGEKRARVFYYFLGIKGDALLTKTK